MNLKSILKAMKLNESTISMALGAVVIIVVGFLVVNYFQGLDEGTTIPSIGTEDTILLPTTHTVKEGEDLWKISEKYYGTGYNWTDIAKANDVLNPNVLEKGQELTIPDVKAKLSDSQPTLTEVPLAEEKIIAEETSEPETKKVILEKTQVANPISTQTYVVVKGDTLWDIAVRAYGDGFRWTDIAEENELANPNLIHPGNIFVLPK